MIREQAKNYIGELKMYANSRGWNEEYLTACDVAMNELEQETVSKESYDHEYFLRKELEIKITKLQRQLEEQAVKAESIIDKIRAEIDLETRIQVKHYTNTDAVIDAVLDVINEYKAETKNP